MATEVDVSKLSDVKEHSGLLSDRVYQVLRNAILSMDFAPGNVIRKGPICEHLGISRSPVSDALLKLSTEKLVDVIPQSSTRVSKISMTEIREGSFLREALEVAAIALAAEKRSEEQLARLSRLLKIQSLLVEDDAFNEFYESDEEFHELIMECSGITILPATVDMVSLQVKRARFMLLPEPGRSVETVAEHTRIFEAIRDKDPLKAQTAMRVHLGQLMSLLEPLETERPDIFVR